MNYKKLTDICFGFYNRMRKKRIAENAINEYASNLSGKTKLTKEQKQQIETFWAPYRKITTKFHELYYEKTGIFSEKYIPVDVYINDIDEYFNGRQEGKYLDNKCYYHSLFAGIKQPEFAVMRCGGFWYNSEMSLISENEAKALVAKETALFVKVATESYGGKGVKYISSDEGDITSQFEEFVNNVKGDLIAQRAVIQHEDLNKINDSSVNTVRVLSLLSDNEVKIYSCVLRVGMQGKRVDNCSSGGITIGITEEGTLKKYAYNLKGERFDRHPSNGFVFEGYKMPSYEKIKDFVKKAHPMVPHFRLVAFDVAVGADGEPIFIEANLCKGMIPVFTLPFIIIHPEPSYLSVIVRWCTKTRYLYRCCKLLAPTNNDAVKSTVMFREGITEICSFYIKILFIFCQ
jgi:hypothetical protein